MAFNHYALKFTVANSFQHLAICELPSNVDDGEKYAKTLILGELGDCLKYSQVEFQEVVKIGYNQYSLLSQFVEIAPSLEYEGLKQFANQVKELEEYL